MASTNFCFCIFWLENLEILQPLAVHFTNLKLIIRNVYVGSVCSVVETHQETKSNNSGFWKLIWLNFNWVFLHDNKHFFKITGKLSSSFIVRQKMILRVQIYKQNSRKSLKLFMYIKCQCLKLVWHITSKKTTRLLPNITQFLNNTKHFKNMAY